MLIANLPLLPEDAREINESLAIMNDGERIVLFNAAGPIFSCRVTIARRSSWLR